MTNGRLANVLSLEADSGRRQLTQEVVTFEQVVEAAITRFTPTVWATLAPDQQKRAIYEEMRRLDHERAASAERRPLQ